MGSARAGRSIVWSTDTLPWTQVGSLMLLPAVAVGQDSRQPDSSPPSNFDELVPQSAGSNAPSNNKDNEDSNNSHSNSNNNSSNGCRGHTSGSSNDNNHSNDQISHNSHDSNSKRDGNTRANHCKVGAGKSPEKIKGSHHDNLSAHASTNNSHDDGKTTSSRSNSSNNHSNSNSNGNSNNINSSSNNNNSRGTHAEGSALHFPRALDRKGTLEDSKLSRAAAVPKSPRMGEKSGSSGPGRPSGAPFKGRESPSQHADEEDGHQNSLDNAAPSGETCDGDASPSNCVEEENKDMDVLRAYVACFFSTPGLQEGKNRDLPERQRGELQKSTERERPSLGNTSDWAAWFPSSARSLEPSFIPSTQGSNPRGHSSSCSNANGNNTNISRSSNSNNNSNNVGSHLDAPPPSCPDGRDSASSDCGTDTHSTAFDTPRQDLDLWARPEVGAANFTEGGSSSSSHIFPPPWEDSTQRAQLAARARGRSLQQPWWLDWEQNVSALEERCAPEEEHQSLLQATRLAMATPSAPPCPRRLRTRLWLWLSHRIPCSTDPPSRATYKHALARARWREGKESCRKQILCDLVRTPLELFFEEEIPPNQRPCTPDRALNKLQLALSLLLAASEQCREELGYCQGLNFIAALLLSLFHQVEDAFVVLCAILRSLPTGLYSKDADALSACRNRMNNQVMALLSAEHPDLFEHLLVLECDPNLFLPRWISCLFITAMAPAAVHRLLDLLLFAASAGPDPFSNPEALLLRLAIGLLERSKAELLSADRIEVVTDILSAAASTMTAQEVQKLLFKKWTARRLASATGHHAYTSHIAKCEGEAEAEMLEKASTTVSAPASETDARSERTNDGAGSSTQQNPSRQPSLFAPWSAFWGEAPTDSTALASPPATGEAQNQDEDIVEENKFEDWFSSQFPQRDMTGLLFDFL